jgi:hypothetical protein
MFRPEAIECWGIQMKGAQDEKPELVKGTVLERFKEGRSGTCSRWLVWQMQAIKDCQRITIAGMLESLHSTFMSNIMAAALFN